MLSLEKPPIEIDGVLIYGDHANSTQFYYAPANPVLSVGPNNEPTFDLTLFRNVIEHSANGGSIIPEELGGGFLTLGVECSHDPKILDTVRKELSQIFDAEEDEITLAPIPLTDGSTNLMGLDIAPTSDEVAEDTPGAAPQFVQSVIGSAKPALLTNMKAVFSVRLSEDGARFMSGLVNKRPRLPIAVQYEYEFEGLMPGVDCRVTARTSSLKRALSAKAGINVVYVEADVEAAIEKMVRNGDVEIEIVSLQTGDTAEKAKDRALKLFKERIIQDLFNPTAPQISPEQLQQIRDVQSSDTEDVIADALNSSEFKIGLELKFEQIESQAELSYRFRESSPVKVSNAVGGFLQSMVSEDLRRDNIVEIDLQSTTDFFDIVRLSVLPPKPEDFQHYELERILVHITYGDVKATTKSLIFENNDLSSRALVFLPRKDGSIEYDLFLTYEFDPAAKVDADRFRYEINRSKQTHPIISLIPEEDFSFTQMSFQHGPVGDQISRIVLKLNGLDENENILGSHVVEFNDPSVQNPPEQHWQLRSHLNAVDIVDVTEVYEFLDGEVFSIGRRIRPQSTFRLENPFSERHLRIIPNVVSERVDLIDVEIAYEDENQGFKQNLLVTISEFESPREIVWPILNPEKAAFKYRVTVHEGGVTQKGEWTECDDISLRVGSDVTSVDEVDVNLIGGDFSLHDIEAVLVELEMSDERDQLVTESFLFVPEGETSTQFTLIRKTDEPPTFRSRIQYFMTTGDVKMTGWEARSGSTRLIVQLSKAKRIE